MPGSLLLLDDLRMDMLKGISGANGSHERGWMACDACDVIQQSGGPSPHW